MTKESNKNICPFGPKTQKFWVRRYDLFSRFDEGIQIDEVGLYSTTPEKIALEQARKMNCKTVVDAFCGVGGNAIAFACVGAQVFAIEKDKTRLEMARHNAAIYGVADKITFILGDFFIEAPRSTRFARSGQVLSSSEETKGVYTEPVECVFVDPPWGGPEYKELEGFKLNNFFPDGNEILKLAFAKYSEIAFKIPVNFDLSEFKKFGKEYEVQDNLINGKVGFRTVYFNQGIA